MTKFVVVALVVLTLLVGGLLGLLRGRRAPMGSPEVLERARQRNRDLDAQERKEERD
jgi:hypothetical protein